MHINLLSIKITQTKKRDWSLERLIFITEVNKIVRVYEVQLWLARSRYPFFHFSFVPAITLLVNVCALIARLKLQFRSWCHRILMKSFLGANRMVHAISFLHGTHFSICCFYVHVWPAILIYTFDNIWCFFFSCYSKSLCDDLETPNLFRDVNPIMLDYA